MEALKALTSCQNATSLHSPADPRLPGCHAPLSIVPDSFSLKCTASLRPRLNPPHTPASLPQSLMQTSPCFLFSEFFVSEPISSARLETSENNNFSCLFYFSSLKDFYFVPAMRIREVWACVPCTEDRVDVATPPVTQEAGVALGRPPGPSPLAES